MRFVGAGKKQKESQKRRLLLGGFSRGSAEAVQSSIVGGKSRQRHVGSSPSDMGPKRDLGVVFGGVVLRCPPPKRGVCRCLGLFGDGMEKIYLVSGAEKTRQREPILG